MLLKFLDSLQVLKAVHGVLQAGEHSPTVGVKLGGRYEGVPVVLLRRPVVQVQVSKLCGTQY